jgi:nucleoside-diphosphate-sugar epimerase
VSPLYTLAGAPAFQNFTLDRRYKLDAPQGVRGRNSDNTLINERLGWSPSISLEDGLADTYAWVYDQVVAARSGS